MTIKDIKGAPNRSGSQIEKYATIKLRVYTLKLNVAAAKSFGHRLDDIGHWPLTTMSELFVFWSPVQSSPVQPSSAQSILTQCSAPCTNVSFREASASINNRYVIPTFHNPPCGQQQFIMQRVTWESPTHVQSQKAKNKNRSFPPSIYSIYFTSKYLGNT